MGPDCAASDDLQLLPVTGAKRLASIFPPAMAAAVAVTKPWAMAAASIPFAAALGYISTTVRTQIRHARMMNLM